MASGTLRNLAESAFVRTPPTVTDRVLCSLLAERLSSGVVMLPDALAGDGYAITVCDPTCGEGDLLEPLARYERAHLFGIEISAERASTSCRRLPRATIVTSAFEATRIAPQSLSLVLANPPYMVVNGHRLEYAVIRDAGKALMPGGVMVAIVPARQWDATMVNHWARNYEGVRAWRFADGDPDADEESFARFTQIVVIGVRRASELERPDPAIKAAIASWRWRAPDTPGESPWAGGVEPPVIPEAPIADPYIVPPAPATPPAITVVRAGDAQLLSALETSGAHLSPAWQAATGWQAGGRVEAPVMPPTGAAHLAADILTGLLDGDVVTGPDGQPYIFNTFVTSEMAPIEVDEDQRGKGVVRILQQQDKAVLTVLSLTTGAVTTYVGPEAFAFLRPWLPALAAQVLAQRRPVYDLDARDWEIAEMAEVGLDKALPGAEFPGLAPAQIHRSIAMLRALEGQRQVAIQGEMGTGKTRMLIGLTRLFARRWACRPEAVARALRPHDDRIQACRSEIAARLDADPAADVAELRTALRELLAARQAARDRFAPFAGERAPRWIRRLQRAWRSNAHLRRLGIRRPLAALPVAVAAPRRVTSVWEYEIAAAYPGCETLVVESHHDVRRWLRRCTESDAPAVVAIFPQSLTRPGRVVWKPAVLAKTVEVEQAVTERAKAERAQWDVARGRWSFPEARADGRYDPALPVRELVEVKQRDAIVAYTDALTGRTITEWMSASRFFCPDCGRPVLGEPRGRRPEREDTDAADAEARQDETLEPVTSITYFVKQRRRCRHCQAPLWTRAWSPATETRAGMPAFDVWSAAVDRRDEQARVRAAIAARDAKSRRRRPRNPQRIAVCPAACAGEQFEVTVRRYGAGDAAWDRLAVGVTLAEAVEDSFSPYQYLLRFFGGLVALAIVDESHNARGKDTDIAASIHELARASQRYVFASGTHYGGAITDFFAYWFRFDPSFWPKLGLGWGDVKTAVDRYGVVQEITREHESDARRGTGRVDITTTTVAAPGISARLLPHLLAKMVFIGVLDVGAFMPPREEIPEVIDLVDPELDRRVAEAREAREVAQDALVSAEQDEREIAGDAMAPAGEVAAAAAVVREAREAVAAAEAAVQAAREYRAARDLAGEYGRIEDALEKLAQKRISAAMLAKGTLPRLWAVQPFGPEMCVTSTKRTAWGDVEGVETLLTTPRLSADHRYPIERRLIDIVRAEREEGRRVMVYFFQNDERPMAPRLSRVLADFHPWTLPNTVDPEDREDAIKGAVASGRSVILVPYTRVIEGLNLQVIDTIIWVEMAMNLFHLDQASRRAWRLGKRETVRLYYLVYAHTVAHKKLHRLGSQSGAAALFAGDTPDGALARSTGADKTTLAQVSSGLEAAEEDLRAAFDRRGRELAAALRAGREWIGVIDTLPERLLAYRRAREAALTTSPATAGASAGEIASAAGAAASAGEERITLALEVAAGPVAQGQPVAEFGDMAAIAAALRSRRRARRASQPATAPAGQADMLADLFGAAAGAVQPAMF